MTSPQLHSVWSRQKEGGGVGNTTGVVSAADIIQTAEEHWNVSGSSVVAAWLAAIIVGVSLLLVFQIQLWLQSHGRSLVIYNNEYQGRRCWLTADRNRYYLL